jgi:hypothetical protein
MKQPSTHQPDPKNPDRDKATIDHLADELREEKPEEGKIQSPTTDSGLPIEEQVRKEWGANV